MRSQQQLNDPRQGSRRHQLNAAIAAMRRRADEKVWVAEYSQPGECGEEGRYCLAARHRYMDSCGHAYEVTLGEIAAGGRPWLQSRGVDFVFDAENRHDDPNDLVADFFEAVTGQSFHAMDRGGRSCGHEHETSREAADCLIRHREDPQDGHRWRQGRIAAISGEDKHWRH